jgi:hypothetical protein
MNINIWRNEVMKQWRWTIIDPNYMNMESGQQTDFNDAMAEITNTVKNMLKTKQSQ